MACRVSHADVLVHLVVVVQLAASGAVAVAGYFIKPLCHDILEYFFPPAPFQVRPLLIHSRECRGPLLMDIRHRLSLASFRMGTLS